MVGLSWVQSQLTAQPLALARRNHFAAPGAGRWLAPWWLSFATAYWSGQPTVAGSSHESLAGIEASARFFLAMSANEAEAILQWHEVQWVFVSDGERAAENSAAILGVSAPTGAF